MSTKVDLQGMLDSFEEQVIAWQAGELEEAQEDGSVRNRPPDGPVMVRAWYTQPGVASRDEIASVPVARDSLEPGEVRRELEHQIVRKLGASPMGCTIRIRAWTDGNAAHPAIDLSRKIMPVEDDEVLGSNKLLSMLFFKEQAHTVQAHTALVQDNAVLGTALAETSKALALCATQRATGAASADLGSPWSILGLAALLLLYPVLRRIMTENPELYQALTDHLKGAWKDLTVNRNRPRIDAPNGAAELEDQGGQAQGDNGGNGGGQAEPAARTLSDLAQLLQEPGTVDRLEALARSQGLDLVSILRGPSPSPA